MRNVFAVFALAALTAIACRASSAPPPSPFEPAIAAFEAADRAHPPPPGGIVFVGSSSVRKWTTLAQDFPGQAVLNRGFGGSQLIDSVRYAARIVIPYAPRQVVLYAGSNDLHDGKTPQQVFADFQEFVRVIHASLPRTRIDFVSIAPSPSRWAEVDRVRATNHLIAAFIRAHARERLGFVEVFQLMLGPDGQPRPELYGPDHLHMTPAGYALWTQALTPRLLPARAP